jgi:hypothetical protein
LVPRSDHHPTPILPIEVRLLLENPIKAAELRAKFAEIKGVLSDVRDSILFDRGYPSNSRNVSKLHEVQKQLLQLLGTFQGLPDQRKDIQFLASTIRDLCRSRQKLSYSLNVRRSPRSDSSTRKECLERKNLDKKEILSSWYHANREYPYPSKTVKIQLAKYCGISVREVDVWFRNARRRIPRGTNTPFCV